MPDAHLGYALPIGGVVATDGWIFPSWVGYDIGCGMCAIPTTFKADDVDGWADEIYEEILDEVPVGFKHNERPISWRDYANIPKTLFLDKSFYNKGGLKQLGTLGGGNHFIEVGVGVDKTVWIIVHSGSRNVGHTTATYYMKEACFLVTGKRKAREGHYGFKKGTDLFDDYVKDLRFCETFALVNREQIIKRVIAAMQEHVDGEGKWSRLINRNHNHVEFRDDMIIHRKGATHADKDMEGVIPGNMRDGSFIVRGLGNPDSLFSSSHGAGRMLGRKQAKELLAREPERLATFVSGMQGITAKVSASQIDESPMAYKDIWTVMECQKDLVDVVSHIQPIINVKG
jgi:tRNA-splicing ligase RtcB